MYSVVIMSKDTGSAGIGASESASMIGAGGGFGPPFLLALVPSLFGCGAGASAGLFSD